MSFRNKIIATILGVATGLTTGSEKCYHLENGKPNWKDISRGRNFMQVKTNEYAGSVWALLSKKHSSG